MVNYKVADENLAAKGKEAMYNASLPFAAKFSSATL